MHLWLHLSSPPASKHQTEPTIKTNNFNLFAPFPLCERYSISIQYVWNFCLSSPCMKNRGWDLQVSETLVTRRKTSHPDQETIRASDQIKNRTTILMELSNWSRRMTSTLWNIMLLDFSFISRYKTYFSRTSGLTWLQFGE